MRSFRAPAAVLLFAGAFLFVAPVKAQVFTNATKLKGKSLCSSASAPTNGQTLVWNNASSCWDVGTTAGSGTVTVVAAGTLINGECVTGGGSQAAQTPSVNCIVDASGNMTVLSLSTGGPTPTKTGAVVFNGITSGAVAFGAADVAGTAIVYVWPSTNGTAGQNLQDTGSTTCPTYTAGLPATCHQLAWVTATAGSPVAFSDAPWGTIVVAATQAVALSANSEQRCLSYNVPSPGRIVSHAEAWISVDAGHYALGFLDSTGAPVTNGTSGTLTAQGTAGITTFTWSPTVTLSAGKYNLCWTSDNATLRFYAGMSDVGYYGYYTNTGVSSPNFGVFKCANTATFTANVASFNSCGAQTALATPGAVYVPGIGLQ